MAEVIPHWLTKQAYLAPNQIAIELENGGSVTFKQLMEESQSFAKKLASIGITKNTHVGILSTNNLEMVIAVHALSYLGAVSVMLNTRLTTKELQFQIDDAEVSLVLTTDKIADERAFTVITIKTFAQIKQSKEKNIEFGTEINLNETFTIIYTSGTTGLPKGVIHTYGNHWWSAIGSALNLGLSKNDKWLATLPIFHVGGLSIFIRSVIYGIPAYLVEKFDETIIHNAIMKKGVTIVSVVTTMLQRLVILLGNQTYPLSFRCMLLGGGPAGRTLLEKAKTKNIPVFQSYGMTETSSQIVTLSPDDALQKIGSAGKALFPAQLKIDNPGIDSVGEIYVKGAMVTKGYFKNDEATDKAFQGGWLATGDLGYLDEAGFLYVVDRRTDLIISGGENIYPSEVESVLSGMEKIYEVGVVGKKDDTWGEVPVAFVVANSKKIATVEIAEYAKGYLASYKIPKEIYFVDKLPRNASNKLIRSNLLKMASKPSN